VLVACQKPLKKLLTTCPGIDALLVDGDPLPPFDVHIPMLSLPLRCGTTTLAKIPADIPYLHADGTLVEHWRRELAFAGPFKIGIAWKGSPSYKGDAWRSIPLAKFAPLAAVPGVQLISLQKHLGREQLAQVRFPVTDLGDQLDEGSGPFMDTAAIMKSLDLVVSCDTVIAHLAGALGVPVWLALPKTPHSHWLLHRADTPWYPRHRLFRQEQHNDWDGVFERMAEALARQTALAGCG
jgi:hypothetical protein